MIRLESRAHSFLDLFPGGLPCRGLHLPHRISTRNGCLPAHKRISGGGLCVFGFGSPTCVAFLLVSHSNKKTLLRHHEFWGTPVSLCRSAHFFFWGGDFTATGLFKMGEVYPLLIIPRLLSGYVKENRSVFHGKHLLFQWVDMIP